MRLVVLVSCALFAGCGRIDFGFGGPGDAGGGDGIVPSDSVAIVAYQRATFAQTPQQGGIAWSSHPDGSVDDVEAIDTNGRALVHVDSGGAVSTSYPRMSDQTPTIHSVLGAEPGETLTFGDPDPTNCFGLTARGTATVTFAAFGTDTYRSTTVCAEYGSASTIPITYELTNATPDPIDLVVVALDTANTAEAAASRLGLPWDDGSEVDFVAGDWFEATAVNVGISGVPAQLVAQLLEIDASTGPNQNDNGDRSIVTPVVAGDTATASYLYISTTARQIELRATLVTAGNVNDVVADRRWTTPQVEALPTIPPLISNATWDPNQRVIAWTTDAPGTADELEVEVLLINPDGPGVVWTVTAPPGTGPLTLPTLPPSAPVVDPSWTGQIRVYGADFDAVTGYAQARVRPEWRAAFDQPGEAMIYGDLVLVLD